jgi:hypothetical protein
MNCERAVELLTGSPTDGTAAERRLATAHVTGCADCRGALVAVHALRMASLAPAPAPRPGDVDRALRAAAGAVRPNTAGVDRFWLGAGAGAALAAAIVAAVFWLAPPRQEPAAPAATPQLEMAVNESREVNISLMTTEPLADAEIHVTLSGAVGLSGYTGQRELRWHTNLDAGTNQLTLPIVATGQQGGQVLVEVMHGGKRRTFLVDVRAHV